MKNIQENFNYRTNTLLSTIGRRHWNMVFWKIIRKPKILRLKKSRKRRRF